MTLARDVLQCRRTALTVLMGAVSPTTPSWPVGWRMIWLPARARKDGAALVSDGCGDRLRAMAPDLCDAWDSFVAAEPFW